MTVSIDHDIIDGAPGARFAHRYAARVDTEAHDACNGGGGSLAAVLLDYLLFASGILFDVHPVAGGLMLDQESLTAAAIGAPMCIEEVGSRVVS